MTTYNQTSVRRELVVGVIDGLPPKLQFPESQRVTTVPYQYQYYGQSAIRSHDESLPLVHVIDLSRVEMEYMVSLFTLFSMTYSL